MRDAMGGSVTIVIIVVFIVVSLGYLAFNVNYMKAFQMKDKIISLYDDWDGECGYEKDGCEETIAKYANEIGYSTDSNLQCPSSNGRFYRNVNNLYCILEVEMGTEHLLAGDVKPKRYYKVVTKINLQIPIISNIFDFRFFYISGDTRVFEKESTGGNE